MNEEILPIIRGQKPHLVRSPYSSLNLQSANHNPSALVFENLMTMDELLTMLRHQYSRHTIYRWIQRHEMPHKRIRGKLWSPKTEVIQWLERSSQ